MYYNPYQYGHGGIGYVPTRQTVATRAQAPRPVVRQATGDNQAPMGSTLAQQGGRAGTLSGAAMGGIGGGLAGAMLGATGLGAIGTAIGTGVDVGNQNESLGRMGVPGQVSYGPALASNLTFGLLGEDPQEQAISAVENDPSVQAQAAAESTIGLEAFGGPGPSSGADGADDSCVVTSQLVASGIWPERNRREYVAYCRKFKHNVAIGEAQRRGYRAWGRVLVKAMKRWPAAAVVGKWVAEAYQDEIRHRMTGANPTFRGKAVALVLEPVSALIGVFKRN